MQNASAGWMAEKVHSTMDPFHEGIMSSLLKSWENPSCNYHSITIFNCLTIVEDWMEALDNEMIVGAILVDQYKAFDCLPHRRSLLHVNNREAGDLRRHRAHYDLTVKSPCIFLLPSRAMEPTVLSRLMFLQSPLNTIKTVENKHTNFTNVFKRAFKNVRRKS